MSSTEETITSLLHEERSFAPPKEGHDTAWMSSPADYAENCHRALDDPQSYWAERASQLVSWFSPWQTVLSGDMLKPEIRWFDGATLNISYNCLDRHLADKKDKIAIIWQGEAENEVRTFTYQQLYEQVCRFANVLKSKGIKKGDRITLYMPMIPELAIALLACTRIGAIHSVVFAGFSAISLQNRINDSQSLMLITADAGFRAGKTIPLKANVDETLEDCPSIRNCIVVRRAGTDVGMQSGRDSWWHDEMARADISSHNPAEVVEAEETMFLLYTSGSTGKPKGVVHTTGGYFTYTLHTTQLVFDVQDSDVFWCTADISWITGHSYTLYGPLGLGATTLIFEGVPTFPGPDRLWRIIDKFKVTIFYTAPTVLRALMRYGDSSMKNCDLATLRILGSVGEPINPEAWMWYHQYIGKGKLPIVDTWWQTETGGIMISPLPYVTTLKPGSATHPLPGIDAVILDEDGNQVAPNVGGHLVIRQPWPGMMRGIYGDPDRYKTAYFINYPGFYDTGDGARQDQDGNFWIMGRLDDVINVSGHRLGTAEIESALVSHPAVSEAAVVGMPHPIKGQSVYAYVTVIPGVEENLDFYNGLRAHVRNEIGPVALPEIIQCAASLPKTRSGKILRRVLRNIAANEFSNLGDTSTLADPGVIEDLIKGKKAIQR